MEGKKWVNVLVEKERMKELSLAKMQRFTREEIIEYEASFRAKDMFRLAKILIEQLGREKAREIYEREIYSIYKKLGRETAEKLGNPNDLVTTPFWAFILWVMPFLSLPLAIWLFSIFFERLPWGFSPAPGS